MQRAIVIGENKIEYTVRESRRARRLRLTVQRDGSVVLTVPARVSFGSAERFVARHAQWLFAKRMYFLSLPPMNPVALYGRREYLSHREEARLLVIARLTIFAEMLGVSYERVAIRDQKTCWGSCSRKGNLNFNYKIMFLPTHLQDYVIVHELAHLRELSHSPRFWAVVASVVPDWRLARRELRAARMLR